MAIDYVNFSGLSHFYNKIKTKFSDIGHTHSNYMTKANPTGTGSLSMNLSSTTDASGSNSVCLGYWNKTKGEYSVSIGGVVNETTGENAFIGGGYNNEATNEGSSVVGGNLCDSNGKYSLVTGNETIANSDYQFVNGKFNIVDDNNSYAHIVGNGTNRQAADRSNAYTLDWSGNGWFAGDVTTKAGASLNEINNSINELNSRPVNNNILINSNFANPVNQREVVSPVVNSDANAAFYTIDRWEMYGTGKLIINDGESITLENTGNLSLYQYIENSELLEGKKVALSAKVNGKIYSNVDTVNQSGGKAVIRVYDDSGVQQCAIYLQYMSNKNAYRVVVGVDNTSVTVEWIKLEVSEVATPYVPRLYEEEYALCQYYYQVFYSNSSTAFVSTSSDVIFTIQCPSKMRIKNPTNALRDGWKVFPNNRNGANQYVSGLTVVNMDANTFQNKIYLRLTGTSLPFSDTNKPYLDAVIIMDAEI